MKEYTGSKFLESMKIHDEHTQVTKSGLVVLIASVILKYDDLDPSQTIFHSSDTDKDNNNYL